jgi:hypothetical protein
MSIQFTKRHALLYADRDVLNPLRNRSPSPYSTSAQAASYPRGADDQQSQPHAWPYFINRCQCRCWGRQTRQVDYAVDGSDVQCYRNNQAKRQIIVNHEDFFSATICRGKRNFWLHLHREAWHGTQLFLPIADYANLSIDQEAERWVIFESIQSAAFPMTHPEMYVVLRLEAGAFAEYMAASS